MADLVADHTGRDDPKTYEDSDVEIMLNPTGDRKVYYQFVVNANGALTDYRSLLFSGFFCRNRT